MLSPFMEDRWFCTAFIALVRLLLAIDPAIFHREAPDVSFRKAARCPQLGASPLWPAIGLRAEERVKEATYKGQAKNGVEYLIEPMTDPNICVVEGCSPIMPVINKPPIGGYVRDTCKNGHKNTVDASLTGKTTTCMLIQV